MRRPLIALAATALAALSLTTAPPATAGDSGPTGDLAVQWESASLKMDGVGYRLVLRSAGGGEYTGYLRFSFQDGRQGKRLTVRVSDRGTRVVLTRANGDRLTGTIGQDGSIFLPKCYTSLKYAEKAMADSSCLFQEEPS